MRDLLPAEAREHHVAGRRVMEAFDRWGYQRVTVPAIEYSDVLGRARSAIDQGDVLRFVEPDTGEVVALRPDMTPQVARLVATRLRDVPGPARLSYQGSVVRRRRERARHRGQISQAGFELIGMGAVPGDLEVLRLATAAVRAAGLEEFTLDLGHAGISNALLVDLPRELRPGVVAALRRKDAAEVVGLLSGVDLDSRVHRALVALPSLCGGAEVWDQCAPLIGTRAEAALDQLSELWKAATAQELAPDIVVDIGETCRFDYYTGAMFQILAAGPGEPVGSGGRYDDLFAGFGFAREAAGFAVDLGNLVWALRDARFVSPRETRIWVAVSEGSALVVEELRRRGLSAVEHADPSLERHEEFARAWGFTHVLSYGGLGAELVDLGSNSRRRLSGSLPADVAEAVHAIVVEAAKADVA